MWKDNYQKRKKAVEEIMGKLPRKKFQSGIYNYCDRWCEKCHKTDKCMLYYQQVKENAVLISKGVDPNNPQVAMQTVGKSLNQTSQLIHKIAEIEKIDLTMTKKDEKKFLKYERDTNPNKHHLYKKTKKFTTLVYQWLNSVPPLDFAHYKNAYNNLAWHNSIVPVKTARAIRSRLEAKFDSKRDKSFHLEDSKLSAWVAYRSAKICKDSLEHMDQFVTDFRIGEMKNIIDKIIVQIDKELL